MHEGNLMAKYGLCPRTLKGELFSILSEHGSKGLHVSELAKFPQIVELDLPNTKDELEDLICSTLSSDITLFEKISSSAYRLRVNPLMKKGMGVSQSDTDDSGSVDDDFEDVSTSSSSSDDSDLDSSMCEQAIVRYKSPHKRKRNKLVEYTEIDESHPGEAWVVGLMEGEYSNLSTEEKLSALAALVDLTGAGSSLRKEDPARALSTNMPNIQQQRSGAKIKKASANSSTLPPSYWGHMQSSTGTGNAERTVEMMSGVHPLQSIFLGSDRRYNSYWIFLGPCIVNEPGHRRVYFESSEDGHWEVIDTEEALCSLLSVLDGRGAREAQLLASLTKREALLSQAMSENRKNESETGIRQAKSSDPSDMDVNNGNGSSPISDLDNNLNLSEGTSDRSASSGAILLELGKNYEEKKQKWDRLQEFDTWIWNSFYNNLNAVRFSKVSYLESLTRCRSCHDLYWRDEKHSTCREIEGTSMFPSHKVLPSQLQALKAAIHAIESVLPEEACGRTWTVLLASFGANGFDEHHLFQSFCRKACGKLSDSKRKASQYSLSAQCTSKLRLVNPAFESVLWMYLGQRGLAQPLIFRFSLPWSAASLFNFDLGFWKCGDDGALSQSPEEKQLHLMSGTLGSSFRLQYNSSPTFSSVLGGDTLTIESNVE
ncbi:hypothetical protein QJS10_CPB22g00981 [Acorus calamus]|uniref:WHIM2 domain-containing protein n=1 Tax=Acorus calamus TaxID=4465 RepID=A0AAV9BXD9_ACOCL|nr:hypothetical protein QJS10_CPB22g00981 [Acorus calamus]